MNKTTIFQRVFFIAILSSLLSFSVTGQAVELEGKVISSGAVQSSIASVSPQMRDEPIRSDNKSNSEMQSDLHEIMQDVSHELSKGAATEDIVAAIVIPIIAILMIFGGPIVLLIVLVSMHYRAKERRQDNINRTIDKLLAAGRDIPLELLRGNEGSVSYEHQNLHKGLRNIGLGIGLLIFLTVLCGFSIGALGFILIGLGASRVIIWFISQNKNTSVSAQD